MLRKYIQCYFSAKQWSSPGPEDQAYNYGDIPEQWAQYGALRDPARITLGNCFYYRGFFLVSRCRSGRIECMYHVQDHHIVIYASITLSVYLKHVRINYRLVGAGSVSLSDHRYLEFSLTLTRTGYNIKTESNENTFGKVVSLLVIPWLPRQRIQFWVVSTRYRLDIDRVSDCAPFQKLDDASREHGVDNSLIKWTCDMLLTAI